MSEGDTPQNRASGSAAIDGLDGALAEWPLTEHTAAEWESAARRIQARLSNVAASAGTLSDDALLAAPLPLEEGEPEAFVVPVALAADDLVESIEPAESIEASQDREVTNDEEPTSQGRLKVADRARDRASFQELANFAKQAGLTPPPSGVHRSAPPIVAAEPKEDSGIIHLKELAASEGEALANLAAEPTAVADDDIVESVDDEPAAATIEVAEKTAPPAKVAAASRAAAVAPIVAVAVATAPAPASPRRSRTWLGGALGALAAVAAVAALFYATRTHEDSSAVAARSRPSPPAEVQATKSAPAPVVAATAHEEPADNAVDPDALPLAQNGAARPVVSGPLGKPALLPPAATATAADEPLTLMPSDTAAVATPTASAVASSATDDPSNLNQAMRQAAGVTPSSATNAQNPSPDDPTDVPLKPSQGAAQSAMAQVTPSARACVGPDDGETEVTVTFGSSGAAQRVSISGGAQGKPAEGCIRAAMMRARVSPFAQASFSWSVIVRPM